MSETMAQLGPRTYAPDILPVVTEDGHLWTSCPGCPGWTAAADSWAELYDLAVTWHRTRPHSWLMTSIPVWSAYTA